MKILLSNTTDVFDFPAHFKEWAERHFKIKNPAVENLKRYGTSFRGGKGGWIPKGMPLELNFAQCFSDTMITLPRGGVHDVFRYAKNQGILEDDVEVVYISPYVPVEPCAFTGTLRPYQTDAINAILKHDCATIKASPGCGKTVIAIKIAQERSVRTLVCVSTKELQQQFKERILQFTDLREDQIGLIGGGSPCAAASHLQGSGQHVFVIAIINTLSKCADKISNEFGMVIVDECHRAGSDSFKSVLRVLNCQYRLGLSATPFRRDAGTSVLIDWFVGPVKHEIDTSKLVELGAVLKPKVKFRRTSYTTTTEPHISYPKALKELTSNEYRNEIIVDDVCAEVRNPGTILILSDRKVQCRQLKEMLKTEHGLESTVLTADLSSKKRQQVVSDLNNGKIKILIATLALLSEGFDSTRLSTLFWASPVRFSARVIQSVGRILRPREGKVAQVYDYVDADQSIWLRNARERAEIYGVPLKF